MRDTEDHRSDYMAHPANNQVYTQGYFNEITHFVDAVEGHGDHITTSFNDVRDAYEIICEKAHYVY